MAEIKQELVLAKKELERQKKVENVIRESLNKHRALTEKLGKENTMKELLLDVITHDLKNPAGVIKGIASLLREEYPKDSMVAMVDESVVNLMSVIDNATTLSIVAGGEEIKKSKINLKELMDVAVNEYKLSFERNDISLINNFDKDVFVNANPIIVEIFKNYLSNALKYSSEGKKLIISAVHSGDNLIVEFADSGNTITKEDREKIFERNVQLEKNTYAGRGLGLAIAKRIADAHNAEVGVKPNSPHGNIFYLSIKKIS